MRKRYLAVTQLELNLRFSEDGTPVRHFLQALLLDASEGWGVQRLDLRYPGSSDDVVTGEFVISAVGDLDGDGQSEIVYGVTIDPGTCHIISYRHDGTTWHPQPIINGLPAVDLIRTIAMGDLDQDGADEIVVGTRPNGAVLILDEASTGWSVTTIDRDQYGKGTTNTREVAVADIDSDGVLEFVVATARASAENWHATPGSIFLYRHSANGWKRFLVDDHGGRTHSRMVAVADVRGDGVQQIISSAVGVVQPESGRIDPKPELRMHRLTEAGATCEPIATLDNMIKSRSFAAGDIDGSGRISIVVGTRALGTAGQEKTCLFIYRFDHGTQAWERETLDASGPLGFHCVAIADVDGDGRMEVVASDDERGLIKRYKKVGDSWQRDIVYEANGPIFCLAIHLIDVKSAAL